jgi:hypothetical protein
VCSWSLMRYQIHFCMYCMQCVILLMLGLDCLSFDQLRCLPEAWKFCFVMSWWCFDYDLLYMTMVMCHGYAMMSLIRCFDVLSSSYLAQRWMMCLSLYNLWVFNQLSLDCFPVACIGLRWLNDLFLMMWFYDMDLVYAYLIWISPFRLIILVKSVTWFSDIFYIFLVFCLRVNVWFIVIWYLSLWLSLG